MNRIKPKFLDLLKTHWLWIWFWRATLVVSLSYAWYCFYVPSNSIIWADNYTSAQHQSAQSDKPIILFFTGKWCVPCKVMKRQVWADDQVMTTVNSEFIPVTIDVDDPDNAAILVRYNVGGTPITIVTDPNGNALQWRVGGIGKSEFLELLRASNTSSWTPQRKVVEMWSEKRAEHNFHESRVPDYELPDPLVSKSGQTIVSALDWVTTGRPALLQLFRENVYGVRPSTDYEITYEEVARSENAFGIMATARQIRATIQVRGKSHSFDFIIAMPRSDAPVPVVVQINNRHLIPLDKAVDEFDPFWPVEKLLRRGYATASFHTSDVDVDKRDSYDPGIRALLDDPDSNPETRWKSLSAWGWAASRVLDFALQQTEIDSERTVVVGHSRGGKAALWAGAEDERFKILYSNNSGCGGAALSRRAFGETVARINRSFPHWFCDRFDAYNDRESELPIDQHQLIALAAPRAVYVASSDEDLWADPRGEYSSLVAAGPVYGLFECEHIDDPSMPALNAPSHIGSTGYHIRTGNHDLTEQDWSYFLDFADSVFEK